MKRLDALPVDRARAGARERQRRRRLRLHAAGLTNVGVPAKHPTRQATCLRVRLPHPHDCPCYDCLWGARGRLRGGAYG